MVAISRPEFFDELFAAGEVLIERHTRRRLEARAPDHGGLVRDAGKAGLRESLVHAWLADDTPTVGLAQLLYGHTPAAARPPQVTVQSSATGVVHLPGIGSLRTTEPDATLELRSSMSGPPTLWAGARRVVSTFVERRTVPDTSIEIPFELLPMVLRVFRRQPATSDLEIEATASDCLPVVGRALALLSHVAPEQRALIERDCRRLVVLRSAEVRSLATLGAYGLAVLSVPDDPNEIWLCEDLIHQVGHISFFAVTVHDCFTIAADTPLARFTTLAGDHRTLYAAFHGNYTMMRMVQFFDACLGRGALSGAQHHEAMGRFAFALRRFEAGLTSIDDERLYTPVAWRLHRRTVEIYRDVAARRGDRLATLDVSNQGYVFDYRRFCARNPPAG